MACIPVSKEMLEGFQKLYEYMLSSAEKQSIDFRKEGLFDHANLMEERAHQLHNYRWITLGDFPGMESAMLDETVRKYSRNDPQQEDA